MLVRNWTLLYTRIDLGTWTKFLKRKLWNISFSLLAVSMETMLTLSDKPSTSYRSHLRDPKTVLEHPKLPLSCLSHVIKWQAPSQTQTGRRTDKYAPSPFALLSQAVTSCGTVWCRLVWVDYPFERPASWRRVAFEKWQNAFYSLWISI